MIEFLNFLTAKAYFGEWNSEILPWSNVEVFRTMFSWIKFCKAFILLPITSIFGPSNNSSLSFLCCAKKYNNSHSSGQNLGLFKYFPTLSTSSCINLDLVSINNMNYWIKFSTYFHNCHHRNWWIHLNFSGPCWSLHKIWQEFPMWSCCWIFVNFLGLSA